MYFRMLVNTSKYTYFFNPLQKIIKSHISATFMYQLRINKVQRFSTFSYCFKSTPMTDFFESVKSVNKNN